MSQATLTITPRHYQALCGLALAAFVLIQMQRSGLDSTVALVVYGLILGSGALAIFDRVRVSPMLVLLAMAAPRLFSRQMSRIATTVDLADILACMAALTYFIGHYRLLGIWSGVLPADARLRGDVATKPKPPLVRSQESLTLTELLPLTFTVPAFAILAEFAYLALAAQDPLINNLLPRWQHFLTTAWTVLLAVFLAVHAFRYWRRLQMDRVTALLMLQDILWNETRGEQRRIQRWLAWKRLRARRR